MGGFILSVAVCIPTDVMTQPAIARFEAGFTTPTLPILERIANAFDSALSVELKPKAVA